MLRLHAQGGAQGQPASQQQQQQPHFVVFIRWRYANAAIAVGAQSLGRARHAQQQSAAETRAQEVSVCKVRDADTRGRVVRAVPRATCGQHVRGVQAKRRWCWC